MKFACDILGSCDFQVLTGGVKSGVAANLRSISEYWVGNASLKVYLEDFWNMSSCHEFCACMLTDGTKSTFVSEFS